jgi:hypothetical protein
MMKIIKILRDWLIDFFRKRKKVLRPCQLNYIPGRLHTNDREALQIFSVGEFLYRRCKPEEMTNPYNTISLAEISHNRAGDTQNIISEANDVLYNIVPAAEGERHADMMVCHIVIKDLDEKGQYDKSFSDDKGNVARMRLLHDPDPCMFPHCVFRVWYNEEVAKMENRNYTRNGKIRIQLKHELASMIYTNILTQAG